ncbi:MAG: hypothetical protein MRY83_00230 [Flavobacteriales bacterium]|nr:hypothetical protein [Flavobacteriales bacterium]
MKSLNSFLVLLVHKDLQKDSDRYTKIMMLQAIILGFIVMLGIYIGFYWYHGSFWDSKSWFNYLGIFGLITSLLFIKFRGAVTAALITTNCLGFFLISASAYLSGGIYSYDLLWYLVLLSSAFLIINKTYGLFITIMSGLAIVVFYLIAFFDLYHFPTSAVSNSIHYKFLNIILVVLITGLIIFVLARGNKKLQDLIEKQRESQIRNAIARDFHDDIGNRLASINQLSSILISSNGEVNSEALFRIKTNSKLVFENFKDFLWYQSNSSSDILELFMYLKDFGEDFYKYSNVNFFAEQNLLDPTQELSSEVSRDILFIFKEFIVNSQKHSQATRIRLKFTLEKNNLTMICSDNGVGFDTRNVHRGMGLDNIEMRAKKIDSMYTLTSNSEGTSLEIQLIL